MPKLRENGETGKSSSIRNSGEPKIEPDSYRVAWINSPEYRKYSLTSRVIEITGLAILCILAVAASVTSNTPLFSTNFDLPQNWPYIVFGIIVAAAAILFRSANLASQKGRFADRTLAAERDSLSSAESRLAESGELGLADLWAITQKRLDYYHDIATDQAKKSFRNAQAAMIFGFLILAISITLSLAAKTTAGSVVAGSLGGLGAIMAGYIGRTFIRTQETTAEHLRSYFNQPLEFSRILAAERLVSMLEEKDRANTIAGIVKVIVKFPEK